MVWSKGQDETGKEKMVAWAGVMVIEMVQSRTRVNLEAQPSELTPRLDGRNRQDKGRQDQDLGNWVIKYVIF